MKGKVRTDIYLTSPGVNGVKGKWIQSYTQLRKYLEENPNVKCDQAVTTTSRKKHREFLEELKKKNQTLEISKSSEDLSLAKIQIKTISKNLTNLETELETLKPLKEQVKFHPKKPSFKRKLSNLMILELREAPLSKRIQTEDNSGEDFSLAKIQVETISKSYAHKNNEESEPSNSKSSSTKVSPNLFQCAFCDSNYSQKTNLYHHVKKKHEENYGNWKLTKSKFYVSNYNRNQSLWKMSGEKQEIPEWSICLDCVPHKILKDSDESMDKHFAENPEHYQINPAWFYLKFNLNVSDIAKQQKYKAIIKSSIICETAREKFRQKIQVQNVAA